MRPQRKRNSLVGVEELLRHVARLQPQEPILASDLLTLYHLERAVCNGCRVNCKENPNCFCAFVPAPSGTRKQGLWVKDSDVFAKLGEDPSVNFRREAGQLVGLSNLGATCYVNSVLQCLYWNPRFRSGIFSVENDFLAQNPVLFQLTKVFAQLQLGKELVVDTQVFADTLQLDSCIQQDGTEFLNLLLEHLEAKLAGSQIEHARSLVQSLFRGKLNYATRCEECKQESERSKCDVDFYQLEVNVFEISGLEQGLDDLFQKELLTGSNKFKCDHCWGERDAKRWIRLRSLPSVLNFCLKRFVFDPLTMSRKKVTSAFGFPISIDMGPRLQDGSAENSEEAGPSRGLAGEDVYDLSAILLHKGSAANSGHYIAHIRDENTGKWWKFDDEEVTFLGDHPLGKSPKKAASAQTEDAAEEADTDNNLSAGANGDGKEAKEEVADDIVEDLEIAVVNVSDESGENLGGKEKGKRKRNDVGLLQVRKKLHMESTEQDVEMSDLLSSDLSILASSEAYMLMYTRRRSDVPVGRDVSESHPSVPVEDNAAVFANDVSEAMTADIRSGTGKLPANAPSELGLQPQEHLRREVEAANDMLLAKVEDYKSRREDLELKVQERRLEVRSILECAPVGPQDETYFFISTEWLRTWADTIDPPGLIDLSDLICSHSKLHPGKVTAVKRISPKAWRLLESKYGVKDDIRLGNDSLCEACIRESAWATCNAESFRNEKARVRAVLERPLGAYAGTQFLVSKAWLSSWMKRKAADTPVEADAGPTQGLVCPHKGLLPESAPQAKRARVPEEVWQYFKQVALQVESSQCPEFAEGAECCAVCEVDISRMNNMNDEIRCVKVEERQKFESLAGGRPTILEPSEAYACLPVDWLQRWRAYVKDVKQGNVEKAPKPKDLLQCMEFLRCKHGLSNIKLPELERRGRSSEWMQKTDSEDTVVLIRWEDWENLSHRYGVPSDRGLKIFMKQASTSSAPTSGRVKATGRKRPREDDPAEPMNGQASEIIDLSVEASSSGNAYLESDPEVCQQCMGERKSMQYAALLSYSNEEIHVALVKGKEPPPSIVDVTSKNDRVERRPKRPRKAASSGRFRAFNVSANTTMGELKLMIWEAFAVMSENQRLGHGTTELKHDDNVNLGDAGVFPGGHFWVIDTGVHKYRDITDALPSVDGKPGEIEQGFAGTALLGLHQSPSPKLLDSLDQVNDEKLSEGDDAVTEDPMLLQDLNLLPEDQEPQGGEEGAQGTGPVDQEPQGGEGGTEGTGPVDQEPQGGEGGTEGTGPVEQEPQGGEGTQGIGPVDQEPRGGEEGAEGKGGLDQSPPPEPGSAPNPCDQASGEELARGQDHAGEVDLALSQGSTLGCQERDFLAILGCGTSAIPVDNPQEDDDCVLLEKAPEAEREGSLVEDCDDVSATPWLKENGDQDAGVNGVHAALAEVSSANQKLEPGECSQPNTSLPVLASFARGGFVAGPHNAFDLCNRLNCTL